MLIRITDKIKIINIGLYDLDGGLFSKGYGVDGGEISFIHKLFIF